MQFSGSAGAADGIPCRIGGHEGTGAWCPFTEALIGAVERGELGGVGLDVYEEEEGKFFRDLSDRPMNDEVLARLLGFPNVLVTGHQGFFTEQAVTTIAETTIANLNDAAAGRRSGNTLV
jgi:D-lactate dehydrogenase